MNMWNYISKEKQKRQENYKESERLRNEMKEKLKQFIKEGKYKSILETMGNFGKYSGNNQMLILVQCIKRKIDVTSVRGFKAWEDLGVHVKKNEKGIMIFQPTDAETYKHFFERQLEFFKKDKKKNFEQIKYYEEEWEKFEEEGKLNDILFTKGFRKGYVFDISQCDKTMEEIWKQKGIYQLDENQVVKNKDVIIQTLVDEMKKIGFDVKFNQPMEKATTKGYCNFLTKEICIGSGSDVSTISTLAHECGHALAHSISRPDFKGLTLGERKEVKEVEAESISYMFCTHLGIDVENDALSYIAGWGDGEIDKFDKNLEFISKYATQLIQAVDEKLSALNEKQVSSDKVEKTKVLEEPISNNKVKDDEEWEM